MTITDLLLLRKRPSLTVISVIAITLCLIVSVPSQWTLQAQETSTEEATAADVDVTEDTVPVTEEPIETQEPAQPTEPPAEIVSATPEKTLPESILYAEVEWVTLTTLRSEIAFNLPSLDEVESGLLIITQPGWSASPQQIPVEVQEFAEPETLEQEFIHLWEVAPDSPPDLFEDVTVTWRFNLTDGTDVELPFELTYADSRVRWNTVELVPDRVLLQVPAGRYSSADLLNSLSPVIDLLAENTGQTPQLQAVIFDPRLTLDPCTTNADGDSVAVVQQSDTEVPCEADAIRELYINAGYSFLELPSADLTTTLTAVTSDLFRQSYEPLWDDAGDDIPAWFRAGLERYYWPIAKIDQLTISQQALRSGGVIRDMSLEPSAASREIWLAQSYGMVLYIAEQVGVDGLFELAERVSDGEDFETAYEDVTDGALSGLIPAWSNWALTRPAQNAYTFYPYLPPTPTATATYTRTPTATATPTITLTPSLTPSVTGELSPTPSDTPPPSRTPTDTPTATLTVTPRSMESLFTPTPVPPDPAVENATSFFSALSLGLIVLGVVLIISVLAYGFFQRNRS